MKIKTEFNETEGKKANRAIELYKGKKRIVPNSQFPLGSLREKIQGNSSTVISWLL